MRALVSTMLLVVSLQAHACWDSIALKYNIHPSLLHAIAANESNFNNKAINVNKNGTRDVCMMQVNSIWLPRLKREFSVTEQDLLNDRCTCLDAGAWILAQACKRGMTWDCVGAYNATSPSKRTSYAWRIYRKLHQAPAKPAPYVPSQTTLVIPLRDYDVSALNIAAYE